MKGNIKILSGKGMEYTRGQMEGNMTGPGKKIYSMESVPTATKMVRSPNESIVKAFMFAQ